uniref:Circumsporozoite protein-like isoform X2 n=1 Tax=Crassostrea virginica TaxID=6565 RepID=A0A8B8EK26_CRAVI|nr:circumsporozoite protein-like isoform X2 [Crassostrea virginica]
MPRKRRGAVEDPKAPAGPAKSHRKEKPPASRNVELPQPSQPPPTVQAPPAPQDSHIPQDPPLAQSQAQVLQAQQSMHNPPPSHTPDLWQNPQPVQDLLHRQESVQQPTEGIIASSSSPGTAGMFIDYWLAYRAANECNFKTYDI